MYGLRGLRVGEASNPGPGRAQRRRRVSSSSADTECDPTLLDDFARDLGVDMTRRDSSSWSTIPVRSQAVIAVPRPPGSFSSGRFAVFADDEQHNDTVVDPVGPTEADANSTAVDSVRQESDTESVLSEGLSVVPESVGTVGNPSEAVESEFETPVPVFRPSARINEGFVSLDIVNVQDVFFAEGLRDEGSPSILQRRIPFCDASRVARGCQRHGVGQPIADHERLETLHIPPASVVDETSERRQGPQKQVVRAGPEVCVR